MARKPKSSEDLKREQDELRRKMQELSAQEREIKAQIKRAEKEERTERLMAAAEAFEKAAAKHKLKIVFDERTAQALAAFAAANGFKVGEEK